MRLLDLLTVVVVSSVFINNNEGISIFQSDVVQTVRQFQFTGWKDPITASVPESRSSMIHLLHLVEKWQQRSGNNVITVHCL